MGHTRCGECRINVDVDGRYIVRHVVKGFIIILVDLNCIVGVRAVENSRIEGPHVVELGGLVILWGYSMVSGSRPHSLRQLPAAYLGRHRSEMGRTE